MKPQLNRGFLSSLAVLCLIAVPASAQVEQVPVMRITGEIEIAAPPGQVWGSIVSGESFVTWCPYWEGEANAKKTIKTVGTVLDFTDDWGNGGKSIVTFLKPNEEIRIAHEPSNGSYICQSKLMLSGSGDATRVVYVEQYTDESSEKDAKATAATMQESVNTALENLKKSVEGK